MNTRWIFRRERLFFVLPMLLGVLAANALADEKPPQAETETLRKTVIEKALRFLADSGQSPAGTFSDNAGPGVTALAITAGLRNGLDVDNPMVKKALVGLEKYVKPDGGIYGNGQLKNYETCVAMVALAEANRGGKYDRILANAKAFVTGVQQGDGQRPQSDPWYGGLSYGGQGRPDLSNTGYFIEALRSVETSADDPAIQRALVFISRCQNLDTKFNDTTFADKVEDGGFYYDIPVTKIDPSTSEERYTPNGGLRSYGSMTYTGLKSMIFAGLTAEDPRVKAATQWIADHYDVDNNPGMGSAGLYYYYHTFASALKAAGIQNLRDAEGNEHDWRSDLVKELASRQQADGSWTNDNRRWFENDKNLATCFALLALAHCSPSP